MKKAPISLILGALLLTTAGWPAAAATPWTWDRNGDGMDDRIAAVHTQGPAMAHRNGDLSAPLRFDLTTAGGESVYGVYVRFDHRPTEADRKAVENLVTHTVKRYLYIDYVRTRATWEQLQAILALPGVDRIEALPYMSVVNDNATKTMQVAGSGYKAFPSVTEDLGMTGRCVVIAILDTGVNDAPDSTSNYPGHESLIGKWVGGGNFSNGDPNLNTPLTGSENPVDRSPDLSHGSHVAGTAMGTGGPTGIVTDGNYGFYRGVAPDARLVDCKVLTDAGVGLGAADGLEWCIYHKDDDWGLAGADTVYRGIQVVNMSLGSDPTDGTDASSAAVNAAVRAGLVVCVSTGNDGNVAGIGAPSAADLALSIGAAIDYNTLARGDDGVASFSNEGPRLNDADGDSLDEMKPSVCPPGAGITSVQGTLTMSSGHNYTTVNGTSMSCPMAAGLCALIVQACPGISPAEVRRILQDTSDHRKTGGKQAPGAQPGYQSIDPNYHPSWGWGNPNAYAAVMESRYPNRTQVISESGEAVAGGMDIRWTTQREVNVTGFHVLRADPLYGGRGAFHVITTTPVTPVGDPFIHRDGNRTNYTYQDRDAGLIPGETYWYRVRWIDTASQAHDEPAFPVVYDPPTPVATLYWSITHNTPDNDLLVYLGSGTDLSDPTRTAEYLIPAPGSGAADSVKSVPGTAEAGNQQRFYHLTLTDRDFGASQVLPPSAGDPWFLAVTEAGFVNRAGRVDFFRIVHHAPGGDVTYSALNPPTPTVETTTTVFWIPNDPALSTNHAPVLHPIGNREALEGRTLEFTIDAHDPDGDNLTYSATALPPGASFTPATRTFSWSPAYNAVATTTTFTATFRVQDDDILAPLDDTETISIRLHDVDPNGNLPPYWNPINDQSVIAGNHLQFKVGAVDPENGALTYSASGLPAGATFDPVTRCFDWTPPQYLGNEYVITFAVNDGTHPDVTEEVIVTVKAGVPPLLGSCTITSVQFTGTSSVGSSDLGTADSDTISVNLPVDAVRLSALLSWNTGPAADLDITVYDANGNGVGGAATFSSPESFVIDNLPAGNYTFVIVGYLVPAETDFTLDLDECLSNATSGSPFVAHFSSQATDDGLRLEWAVASGPSTVQFDVYRSGSETGTYAKVNASPVLGDGVYQFIDRSPTESGDHAWYRLHAVYADGRTETLGPWNVDVSAFRPAFSLAQNAPNPFQASGTLIRFRLGETSRVRLMVFDVRGALVRTLVDGVLDRGQQEVAWDGRDDGGRSTSAGLYFYRMEVPNRYLETRRMIRLR